MYVLNGNHIIICFMCNGLFQRTALLEACKFKKYPIYMVITYCKKEIRKDEHA